MAAEGALSPEQYKAIECLLVSGNVAAAAREAGISRRQMYRWLHDPVFTGVLHDAEGIALQGLTRSLMALGDKATAALTAVFDDEAAPHTVKLKAASIVFANHPQYLQSVALAERVAALEAAVDEGER